MKFRRLIVAAGMWLWLSAAAQAMRVAFVGEGDASREAAKSLAEAITDPSIQVVPALTAAQAADPPAVRPSAPEVIVVVRHTDPNPAAWRLDVCNVAWGTCMADQLWDQSAAGNQPPPVADMAAAVSRSLACKLPPEARATIVLPLVSADFSQVGIDDRRVVRFELEQAIMARGTAVMDLPSAAIVGIQRAAAGLPPIPLPEPLIISGQVKHVAGGDSVTIGLIISYEGKKLHDWTSDPTSLADCAAPLSRGLNLLLLGLPAAADNRKAPDIQNDLRGIANALTAAGTIEDAWEVQETALLLDPTNAALQGECASSFTTAFSDQEAAATHSGDANQDREETQRLEHQFEVDNADELLWELSHIQAYWIGTEITQAEIMQRSLPLSFQAAMAPDAAVRESVCRILRAKRAQHVNDCIGSVIAKVLDQQQSVGSEEEQLAFAERLGDVWIEGPMPQSGVILVMLWHFADLQRETPRGLRLVEYLEHSQNPDAPKAAADIRRRWAVEAASLAQAHAKPATPPQATAPTTRPTAQCVSFELPHQAMDMAFGFVTAGPHADIYYAGADAAARALYYFRDDGTGRKFGSSWGLTQPMFDGRYVWFVGRAGDTAVIQAFDPATGQTWATRANDPFPQDVSDESWLAAVAPGQACIIALIGQNTRKTWVGLLRLDPGAGITVKVALTCGRADPNQKFDDQLDAPFQPDRIALLPGPPGAGEHASPHLYISRGFGLEKYLMLDPQSGECSLCGNKGLIGNGRRDQWIVWQDKVYHYGQVWDPRTDTTKPASTWSDPTGNWAVLSDGYAYYCSREWIYRGKPGETPVRLPIEFPKAMLMGSPRWQISSLFGLVNDAFYRVCSIPPAHADIPAARVDDEEAWMHKYARKAQDVDVYDILARHAEQRGDIDDWAVQVAGAIKYFKSDGTLESNLWHAQEEVELANYFMHRRDYKTAQRYSDDAAQVGSEWAMQNTAYVAEGMGNFQRAEQIIRKVGEEHGNTFSWYNWCMRSGHGDVKAARALLMQAADQADQAGQPLDALSNRAWVAELEGDPKTAKPMLLRLATEKHDPQAGMELAFMAADAGDAAERDNMLNLVAEQPLTDSPPIPNPILPLLRSFFHHDGVLDPALLKNVLQLMPTDEICPEAILYYDLGRAYLSRGEKAKAIENFRHAAGLNSHRVSRALAAMQLRKLGEPVPPPGQWGPPQK